MHVKECNGHWTWIENFITRDNCLASLRQTLWCWTITLVTGIFNPHLTTVQYPYMQNTTWTFPRDGIFNLHLTTVKYPYMQNTTWTFLRDGIFNRTSQPLNILTCKTLPGLFLVTAFSIRTSQPLNILTCKTLPGLSLVTEFSIRTPRQLNILICKTLPGPYIDFSIPMINFRLPNTNGPRPWNSYPCWHWNKLSSRSHWVLWHRILP